MAAPYDLYFVSSYNIFDGKGEEARAWLDRALPFWQGLAGVLSVKTYGAQFSSDSRCYGAGHCRYFLHSSTRRFNLVASNGSRFRR